ncbi:hypothetical protein EDB87DRAFT_1822873 [Lactarius vividus]|nr:hypothetical protein EDB87DRAFT_1822873 [Lactarius vividus]
MSIFRGTQCHQVITCPAREYYFTDFDIGCPLGKGKFGRVYMVPTKLNYTLALKCLYKSEIIQAQVEKQIHREIKIQQTLQHPNVLRLHGYFRDEERNFLMLEFAGNEMASVEAKEGFHRDLWDFTTQFNDGHTRWYPQCYNIYQNILPAPVVLLDDSIFIAPDTVELLNNLGPNFAGFFAAKNFNWQRLAGARVLTISGLPASVYIDKIGRTVSGNYLSHDVRVNSVVSSYRITQTSFSQRLGDLTASSFLTQTSLTFSDIPVNSTSSEVVEISFAAAFVGNSFTDGPFYWANKCAANDNTNGRDDSLRPGSSGASLGQRSHARAARVDLVHHKTRIKLPNTLGSALTAADGSDGVIKSFILPGSQTGVMFIGSFEGNFSQFPLDVEAAVRQFTASGVTNLLIDVTNNGVAQGGYVCLGMFLHQFLSGTGAGSSLMGIEIRDAVAYEGWILVNVQNNVQ